MNTSAKRSGLLALAVTFSAGIHAALVPEHLKEMPPLGYSFIAAAVIGAVLAWALVSRPDDRRLPLLAGLFCLGQIATWVLFVTVPVPLFSGTPEPVEVIALVSKAAELLGILLVLPVAIPSRLGTLRWSRHRSSQSERSRVLAADRVAGEQQAAEARWERQTERQARRRARQHLAAARRGTAGRRSATTNQAGRGGSYLGSRSGPAYPRGVA